VFWVFSKSELEDSISCFVMSSLFVTRDDKCLTSLPSFSPRICSGLIVAVILTQAIRPPNADNTTTYSMYNGYAHMAAGLCCGISCLAAGGTIGVIGDAGVQGFGLKASGGKRSWATEGDGGDDVGMGGNSEAANADGANKLYVGLLIMLIFSEALAL
jgi:V-type H+-transporting ATPase proteolipid subunit